ncbi:MAG: cellulase family glycosylhydrolase [Bacteroidales bacterium]|nr:cellulase family glycosylhydrolase [Bacteroidales bacterium]
MKRILFLALIAILLSSCKEKTQAESAAADSLAVSVKPYPQQFAAYKGVNIAHWLSQVFGWSPRATFFTQEDVKLIKNLGFDHIRMPIDEEQLWTVDGKKIDTAFNYLKQSVEWCVANDLCIIIDLHIIRSHHFNAANGEGKMTLWTDTVAQNTFLSLWDDLQTELKQFPANKLAYELMNEPAAPEAHQWNSLVNRAITRIRKTEPNRILFIGANQWQTIHNMPFLETPKGDSNIVIAFHNYDPMLVTHHLASWTSFKAFTGKVQYPGLSASPEDLWKELDSTDMRVKNEIKGINKVYSREYFDSIVSIAVKRSKELDLSVYCGEFGCLNNVDTTIRHAYYRDFVGTLNKYKIGKAVWDYKGSFQIMGYNTETMQNTNQMDTVIVKILTE